MKRRDVVRGGRYALSGCHRGDVAIGLIDCLFRDFCLGHDFYTGMAGRSEMVEGVGFEPT